MAGRVRAVMRRRMEEEEPVADIDRSFTAFVLVVAAGLCTAIGAAAVFEPRLVKLASKPVLAIGLAFAAGVMIYVSLIDIFTKSFEAFLEDGFEEKDAYLLATVCTFSGMIILKLLTLLVYYLDPHHDDDFELPQASTAAGAANAPESREAPQPADTKVVGDTATEKRQLKRMGLNAALAIAIHNMPEGLATFVGYLAEESVGVALAVGIGFHNIPEGLCVALPIYYSTGSRIQGFLWAILSGVSEPIGALIGYFIFKSTDEDLVGKVYGALFGIVAGMMIMIAIQELLPTAAKYDPKDRFSSYSAVVGMAMIAASLVLFQF